MLRPLPIVLLAALLWWWALPMWGQRTAPKREFRGGWIQVVNGQLRGLSTAQAQQKLLEQVEALRLAGCNAVIFQVRPEADALYPSSIEPWSRLLTGTQGQAPSPYWDPLAYMIDLCHEHGMELHAWINPYRARTSLGNTLSPSHPAALHPEWFVTYGDQLFFDPSLDESRDHICRVVLDIVSRYDVDGIHLDDYFYPYPIAGTSYPDDERFASYLQSATSRAGEAVIKDRGDWRRHNVDLLIEQLHRTIVRAKPWVKFGVSPFGIYRNQSSDPDGSATRGLQNYDDLYADVLLWARQGWIDYLIPQIYWPIGHPAADYATLVDWWADHSCSRPLFIGQSVLGTVQSVDPDRAGSHQLRHKMRLQRAHRRTIQGSCQWYAAALADNPGNYREALAREYHRYPALQPRFTFIDSIAPGRITRLKANWTAEGYVLTWSAPKSTSKSNKGTRLASMPSQGKSAMRSSGQPSSAKSATDKSLTGQSPSVLSTTDKRSSNQLSTPDDDPARQRQLLLEMSRAVQYVVYRFAGNETVDLNDPSHIVAITRDTHYLLPYSDGRTTWRYVVTALDRLHNESAPVSRRVKL